MEDDPYSDDHLYLHNLWWRPTSEGVALATCLLFNALHDNPSEPPANEEGPIPDVAINDEALPYAAILEDQLRVLVTDQISPLKLRRLGSYAANWHASQPLEAAELDLIRRFAMRRPIDIEADQRLARIHAIPEQPIVSRGMRSITSGALIIDRWRRWHAQTDEYSGQETLRPARTALLSMNRWALYLAPRNQYSEYQDFDIDVLGGRAEQVAWSTDIQ